MMGGRERRQSSSSRNNFAVRPYSSKKMPNKGGKNVVFYNCRLQMMMKYSMTAENSGRPFYGCPNYKYEIYCDFFRWTDGCEKLVYAIHISQEILH
ncbi:hypothetical protein Ahy_A05g022413 [Arachis hypogaea]|uniref:GRF-type domain-containing protein n=1 Tax=Arachis hypogaea TaxID=3818 RepID=A0A445D0L4_ARAHY|nr:hypothetical protein Ahy_A05g022413 [Arachis hypogaea]